MWTSRQSLQVQHVVTHRQTVGRISAPWGSASDVLASEDLDVPVLSGTVLRSELRARVEPRAVAAGTAVGSLHVTAGPTSYDVPVVTASPIDAPGRLWRLVHIAG